MFWYLLIFVGTLLEGEFTLVLIGFVRVDHPLDTFWLHGLSFAGVFLGDLLFFHLGRSRGKTLLARWPKLASRAEGAATWLNKYPTAAIFILRFQIGFRMAGNFALGMGGAKMGRYLLLNALACAVWAWVINYLCLWFAGMMIPIWSQLLG